MEDVYEFQTCSVCGRMATTKNGRCNKCELDAEWEEANGQTELKSYTTS